MSLTDFMIWVSQCISLNLSFLICTMALGGWEALSWSLGPVPPQLNQEVERRQRLGQESAARKALIASSYHPARPELYSPLQVPGRGRSLGAGRIQAGLPAPQLCVLTPGCGSGPRVSGCS